jgi:hypothetical protein
VGHDVEQEAIDAPGVEEREDVRMLEVGGDPDFVQEALATDRGGKLGPKDLQSDLCRGPD